MVFDLGVILVAHRAANDPEHVGDGEEAADMVELDVHLWRSRLEVRHAKRLWLFQRLWEQWEYLPRDTVVPSLDEALSAIDESTPLLVDLKGWSPRLAARVRARLGESRSVVVSARGWWLLRGVRGRPDTTTLRSVGTRWQLMLAMRFPNADHGVVVHQRLLGPVTTARLVERYQVVFTWNVETEERAIELVDMGVGGLIMDDLDLIRVLRSRRDA